MDKFIEIMSPQGTRVLVNLRYVVAIIEMEEDHTKIVFHDNDKVVTEKSFKAIYREVKRSGSI